MSVLSPTGPNSPPIIPSGSLYPPTEAIHAPTEHYTSPLRLPDVPQFETTGDYQSVHLNGRPPLLPAAEVETQLPGHGDMLGDLLAVIEEPFPPHLDTAKTGYGKSYEEVREGDLAAYERRRGASNIYVFCRDGLNGPEYTIMGTAALSRLAERRQNPEGSIIYMTPGDQPLMIGNQDGNWLPSSGYDRAAIQRDPELANIHSTVSRQQARFIFDEKGNLHYQEADKRKNAAKIQVHKTQNELLLDGDRAQAYHKEEWRLYNERTKDDLTLVQGSNTSKTAKLSPNPEQDDTAVITNRGAIYGQSLHTPRGEPRLHVGRLVGEQYTGQHRRAGFLGRLAARIFGQ